MKKRKIVCIILLLAAVLAGIHFSSVRTVGIFPWLHVTDYHVTVGESAMDKTHYSAFCMLPEKEEFIRSVREAVRGADRTLYPLFDWDSLPQDYGYGGYYPEIKADGKWIRCDMANNLVIAGFWVYAVTDEDMQDVKDAYTRFSAAMRAELQNKLSGP